MRKQKSPAKVEPKIAAEPKKSTRKSSVKELAAKIEEEKQVIHLSHIKVTKSASPVKQSEHKRDRSTRKAERSPIRASVKKQVIAAGKQSASKSRS